MSDTRVMDDGYLVLEAEQFISPQRDQRHPHSLPFTSSVLQCPYQTLTSRHGTVFRAVGSNRGIESSLTLGSLAFPIFPHQSFTFLSNRISRRMEGDGSFVERGLAHEKYPPGKGSRLSLSLSLLCYLSIVS